MRDTGSAVARDVPLGSRSVVSASEPHGSFRLQGLSNFLGQLAKFIISLCAQEVLQFRNGAGITRLLQRGQNSILEIVIVLTQQA